MSLSLLVPFFQPPITPLPPRTTFAGKTAIVTGANSGIGKETARQLVLLDAKTVILAVRNTDKGEKARTEILADPAVKTRDTGVEIKVLKLDLDEYESVATFVKKVEEEADELDLLVLNAARGGIELEFSASSSHERIFQANYLSNAFLILRLLPLLFATAKKNGAKTRITWVGSRAMNLPSTFQSTRFGDQDSVLAFFDDGDRFAGMQRYGDSKLLGAMFIAELAKRRKLEERGVVLNMLYPGMVDTDFTDDLPWYMRVPVGVLKKMRGRSADEGARVVLWAALVAEGESVDGRVAEDQVVVEPSAYMQSKEGQKVSEKLWMETLEEMGKYMYVPQEPKI